MKKKMTKGSLKLGAETIRTLSGHRLGMVRGGLIQSVNHCPASQGETDCTTCECDPN